MKKIKNVSSSVRGRSVFKALGEALEAPPIAGRTIPHIEITGACEAITDGCRGVLEYDNSVISLNLGGDKVRFRGENLQIHTLTDEQAMISGKIYSVEFFSE